MASDGCNYRSASYSSFFLLVIKILSLARCPKFRDNSDIARIYGILLIAPGKIYGYSISVCAKIHCKMTQSTVSQEF